MEDIESNTSGKTRNKCYPDQHGYHEHSARGQHRTLMYTYITETELELATTVFERSRTIRVFGQVVTASQEFSY